MVSFRAYFTNIYTKSGRAFPSRKLVFLNLPNKYYWLLLSKKMAVALIMTIIIIIIKYALRYCLGHSDIGPMSGSAVTIAGNDVTRTLQIRTRGKPPGCDTSKNILGCYCRKDTTEK